MEDTAALVFYEALKTMIAEGRPAWKEFQEICDNDPDINLSEAIAWLEDIDGSIEIQ